MKYLKIPGAVLLAMAGLMALTGTASATVATSPAGTVYTSTIKGASTGGHVKITGPLGISAECASTFEVKIEKHGAGVTAGGNLSSLTFTGCTNGYSVSVLAKGSTEWHLLANGNATLTSTGTEITVTTPLGFNCIYGTNAADLGTWTSSKTTGGTPVWDLPPITVIARKGHSGLCGATGGWTGSYRISTPDYLDFS
jgi:hypothetical protein